jgi:hypothetical protein
MPTDHPLRGLPAGRRLGGATLAMALFGLAACASVPPPPPPPPGETMARPGGAPRTSVNKRQYLDERTGRYYYFDRTRQAYFWEDGSPKR